ncbi:hypothetical protein [Paraliomyxa miuraensis]|uniref:hypothetical protein n=1 Tax=Paraliomyxa miuraensis TaxID=376150 RepID=UPI0022563BC1|nr:hypothetical protein [Paraliomyxa miuraensis]MCX4241955.1 hypothetical protein [Paraliomyxa miuraensis]
MSSSERTTTRRQWLIAAPLGVAALGLAAHRWWSSRSPEGGSSALTSIQAGQRLDRWTVVRVHPLHLGAVPVVLETADGKRYQVDVLSRDPSGPEGVATTEHLSLYVVDIQAAPDSDGQRPTDEEQGLGAMVLARALAREPAPDGLLTLSERQRQFPRGSFGVPLV